MPEEKKSPLMIGFFLLLWMAIVTVYGTKLWQLINAGRGSTEIALLAGFSLLLVIFWSLAAYYFSVILFSYMSKPLPDPPDHTHATGTRIAILYTTCDDFQFEAAESCLKQDYPDFHLFLLDDSTDEDFQRIVDSFHNSHPEETTVVRRETRTGFKAGNLNHALHGAAKDFPVFAVVDADERVPTNFLRRAMSYLLQSDCAFVQANHRPNPKQKSRFAQDIGPTILPFWDVHCKPRNKYGFVPFVGHGAIVRRSAWETAGGFPEIVTEDLGFSIRLGECGLRGIFIHDLVCQEDFPADYLTFKRQQERYIVGTTQIIHRYFFGILRADRLTWQEKMDIFLWCSPLYVPALVFLFLIMGSIILPIWSGTWHHPVVSIVGARIVLPPVRLLDGPFRMLSSWDFQLFSLLSALAPAFAGVALGFQRKLKVMRLLFLSTVPFLSLMVVAWRGILGYVVSGKVLFSPTGHSAVNESMMKSEPRKDFHTTEPGHLNSWMSPWLIEIITGLFFAFASLISLNVGLFGVSSCLIAGSMIQFVGWEKKSVRLVAMGCFSMILLQMALGLLVRTASLGSLPLIFSIHF